jgi:4-hydroxy-tetrahydrodipicolinate reductase
VTESSNTAPKIRITVAGAAGRMGRAIIERIHAADDLELAAAVISTASGFLGHDAGGGIEYTADLDAGLHDADLLLDFSLPGANLGVVQAARASKTPLVCGVTGLSKEQMAGLDHAAADIPVLYASNTSIGVTLLLHLLEVARDKVPEASARVHEIHHAAKLDAPSGTALVMGLVTGVPAEAITHERVGEVPGEHEVVLDLGDERLEFAHRVADRGVFADGALRAARWLVGKPAGRYSMADVLGL